MQRSRFSKGVLQLPALPRNWNRLSLRKLQLAKTHLSKGILYHHNRLKGIWILVEKKLGLDQIVSHLLKDSLHANVAWMPSPETTGKSSRLKETKFRYWLNTKWSRFESAISFLRCRTDLHNLSTCCVTHPSRTSIEDTKLWWRRWSKKMNSDKPWGRCSKLGSNSRKKENVSSSRE